MYEHHIKQCIIVIELLMIYNPVKQKSPNIKKKKKRNILKKESEGKKPQKFPSCWQVTWKLCNKTVVTHEKKKKKQAECGSRLLTPRKRFLQKISPTGMRIRILHSFLPAREVHSLSRSQSRCRFWRVSNHVQVGQQGRKISFSLSVTWREQTASYLER